jgi:hypothetical protein
LPLGSKFVPGGEVKNGPLTTGSLFAWVMMEKLGRRATMTASMTVAGVALLVGACSDAWAKGQDFYYGLNLVCFSPSKEILANTWNSLSLDSTGGRCYNHNFLRFLPIFSKTNVMITIFAKTNSSFSKKRQIFL